MTCIIEIDFSSVACGCYFTCTGTVCNLICNAELDYLLAAYDTLSGYFKVETTFI